MLGFLVVNAYLKGEKFDTLHSHLLSSAKKEGVNLVIKTNEEMLFEKETPDFVLFWDKDINLARLLEKRGVPVYNSARSIELCDDKAKTYLELLDTVPQPKTIIAPLSFNTADYENFVKNAVSVLGLPVVFKDCFGSFGEQVFLCKSEKEVLSHITSKPFLLQEFVKDADGEDIRIEVVGEKCVSAMLRKNENDFRSNITNGGVATPYEPTEREIYTALLACKKLGLTFGGVDILRNGQVLEVNSNAHIINIMNTTGVDIAPLIFKEIL